MIFIPMRPSINVRRGVTLLELIMVMVLLFIIAGITVPYLAAGLPDAQIRSGANQVYAALHVGRNEAATYGFRTRFIVDQEKRTWRLLKEPKPFSEPDEFSPVGPNWVTTMLPEGVSFSELEGFEEGEEEEEFLLEFQSDGSLSESARVVLTNEDGDSRTLEISAATGRVVFVEEEE